MVTGFAKIALETMETSFVLTLVGAVFSAVAASLAVASNRFHHVSAGICVLLAGWVPVVSLVFLWSIGYKPVTALILFSGCFGSGPLFLAAYFLYSSGTRTLRMGVPAWAAGAGVAGGFTFGFSMLKQVAGI